jgi:hypothetical protein
MAEPRLTREEVAASLAAGRDLGPDYDQAVADSLVDQLDRIVEERVRTRVAEQVDARTQASEARHEARTSVAIASLIFAVPLSAIAAGTAGVVGLILTWVGIVLVNIILAWDPRS